MYILVKQCWNRKARLWGWLKLLFSESWKEVCGQGPGCLKKRSMADVKWRTYGKLTTMGREVPLSTSVWKVTRTKTESSSSLRHGGRVNVIPNEVKAERKIREKHPLWV